MSGILQKSLFLSAAIGLAFFLWGAPLGTANLIPAESISLASADSSLQDVGTKLVFAKQPPGGAESEPWPGLPSVSVSVQDANGNLDGNYNSVVTLSITSGTGASGAKLTCQNEDENPSTSGMQVSAGNGVVFYFGCSIDKAHPTYTLTASASGLTSAISNTFAITASPTPTPTATPRPATPTPTPTPSPPPAPVTQDVGPSGGSIPVGGGANADGGVTLNVPSGTFSSNVKLTVSVTNSAPIGVKSSGGVLLSKVFDVTTDTGATLNGTVELQVNLTAAELGGRSINSIRGGVIVGNTVEPRPTRVLNAGQGTIGMTIDHFTKFTVVSVLSPGPSLVGPAVDSTLSGLGTTLMWSNPSGSTQYHLQVAPFNGDGPGVNVVRNAETSFVVPAPPDWYGLLPDMLYFWRVRTTTVSTTPTEDDWTSWDSWTFRTPGASSATISPVSPAQGAVVSSLTPSLTWANSNSESFYYEVQVSKDSSFNTDGATATAMVYWVLLHGGVTSPANTYAIPASFPLEAGTSYFWRVRPRIQGDGEPVAWSDGWSFSSP